MSRKQNLLGPPNRHPANFETLEERCLMTGVVDLPIPGTLAEVELATGHREAGRETKHLPPAGQANDDKTDSTAIQRVIEETCSWRTESALITTLAQAAVPPEEKPATSPPAHLLPRGQQVPSRTLPRPSPIGVFRDGSVRTVHPDIDPRVLELLRKGGRAPIPWTTHRPGIAYGAPTNTLAGLDPTLRLLLEMQPNWQHGVGQMLHSYHGIRIQPADGMATQQQLFHWLQDFRHFNHNNIAHARMVRPSPLDTPLVADHRYVLFHPLQIGETAAGDELVGILNSIQSMVNGPHAAIRLFVDPANSYVMGVTLGDHMLAGARTWRVRTLPGGDLAVETESWSRRNGQLNNIALQYGGRQVMTTVWIRYLANIGNAATQAGGSWRPMPSSVGYRPQVIRNPFRVRAAQNQWIPPLEPESPDPSR